MTNLLSCRIKGFLSLTKKLGLPCRWSPIPIHSPPVGVPAEGQQGTNPKVAPRDVDTTGEAGVGQGASRPPRQCIPGLHSDGYHRNVSHWVRLQEMCLQARIVQHALSNGERKGGAGVPGQESGVGSGCRSGEPPSSPRRYTTESFGSDPEVQPTRENGG